MADTRIYRKIYRIDHTINGDSYSLIDVFSITAECFRISDSFLIENPVVYNESTGFYYVILDNNIYSPDDIYEVVWSVKYISSAPIKELTTRFRFNVSSSELTIVEGLDYDINDFGNQYEGLEYEIKDFGNKYEGLEYEIFYN